MEPAGAMDSPGAQALLSPSALPGALSDVLHRLSAPEARRGRAAREQALGELGALLEAAEGGRLLADDDGMAELLGRVARALETCAAPAGEEERGGGQAERAARAGRLLLRVLGAAGRAGLRHVAGPVYLFAVTHGAERPWSSPESRAVAAEALASLLRAAGCSSVAGFLRGETAEDRGRFGGILGLLRPQLNKDSWKKNPAVKHIFSWTLQQVTRPWLSQHLEGVLPPSLLISDDYQTENKILGVRCLQHIVLNVPAADLLQYNRAEVLYHAIFNHLYAPEHQLIEAVLPCLLDLFPVLEKGLQWKGEASRPTTHCDAVLQLVLTHMEPEHRILLRRTYARNLPAFVRRLGILTVRHMKRLERVILGYLEVYDGPEEEARLKILETLKLVMQCTWPRVPCRLVVFLKALLKLICDVARDPSLTPEPVKSALLQEATECLIILDHCSHGQVKILLAKVLQSCEDHKVVSCLRKVHQASEAAPQQGT
ncbi:TELO2-interacting protein 2 [Ochotona princeps]|uniref:TELO2-interacting protein 2 n=1 Tax=Ochotona princeps TaxID=9978 RepID=UPI00271500DF|nr:TELO2-interacting protein 2 [Ochotona princeps]